MNTRAADAHEVAKPPCVRFAAGSIWAMSERGTESQTIVLFEIPAHRVRKLVSPEISGC